MKKVVDLFAGCGGLSLGFQNAGFSIIAAFEYWKTAAQCYELNFRHPVFQDDLSNVRTIVSKLLPMSPDVIIGGPPCQDFSNAGNRIEAKRAGLTESFAQIVTKLRPNYFVMENVDRAEKSMSYARARQLFVQAGYGLTEIVLDASLCGVPQKRKRFFCIGALDEKDGFLLREINAKLSNSPMTLRDYFGNTLDFEFYYRHPRNYSRRAIFSIDEPAPTIRGVNRPLPKGYPGHPNDSHKIDKSIRALTTLERALIQTFPANFKWVGSKTDMEQMIGNAVPVKLGEFVANRLMAYITNRERPDAVVDYSGFRLWLAQKSNLSLRTQRDVVSRLKRVNSIFPFTNDLNDYYTFQLISALQQRKIVPAVASHLKRSVKLYSQYLGTKKTKQDSAKSCYSYKSIK